MSVIIPSNATQQDTAPDTGRRGRRDPGMTGHAMAARYVLTDPRLSITAKTLWSLLDARIGTKERVYVKRQTLADDLSIHRQRIGPAITELRALGLVVTGRGATDSTDYYGLRNPARILWALDPDRAGTSAGTVYVDADDEAWLEGYLAGREQAILDQQRRFAARSKRTRPNPLPKPLEPSQERRETQHTVSRNTAPDAAKHDTGCRETQHQRESNKRKQKQEQARNVPLTAPVIDSLSVEEFLAGLPSHLRPQATQQLAELLAAAASRGWTMPKLSAVIVENCPNPSAGPGLAVTELRKLSQHPAEQYVLKAARPAVPIFEPPKRTEQDQERYAKLATIGAADCRAALAAIRSKVPA